MSDFIIVFVLCILYLCYHYDYHTKAKNKIVKKYKQFRDVNKLVKTKYKSVFMILWVSCNMIAKMYWMNFLQWANNSIEYVDNGKGAIISYILNGKIYKLFVKIKKGPNDILLITDENSNDITDEVLPFLGPNHEWHKTEFTPSFWKRENMTFELSDGLSKTFSKEEIIN